MFRSTLAACGILVLLTLPTAATAAPGSLDPLFGTGGASVGAPGTLVALDHDGTGRLVAAGRPPADDWGVEVVRRTSDGELDPAFGDAGTVSLRGSGRLLVSVAPDDSVFVTGSADTTSASPTITRLGVDGTPDPTFSPDLEDWPLRSILATADGLLVLPVGDHAKLLRLTSTGARDPAFGDGGSVVLPIARSWASPFSSSSVVALRPDGSIVVAGSDDQGLVLVALTPAGQPLPGFGTDGVARLGRLANPDALGIGPDGDIVVVGGGTVVRVTSDGELDPSFGPAGARTLDLGVSRDTLLSAATVEADGSVLVAGSVAVNPLPMADPPMVVMEPRIPGRRYYDRPSWDEVQLPPDSAVTARLTPSGTLDCSYGTYGYQRVAPTPPPGGPLAPISTGDAALFEPGRTVIAGRTQASDHAPSQQLLLAVQRGAGNPVTSGTPVAANALPTWWNSPPFEGWVDPRCGDVTAHFEYGPTTAYGARTPDQAIRGADGPRAVEAYVPPGDLAVGEYHYRLVAEGAAGTAVSADRTFTIVEEPGLEQGRTTPTVTAPVPPPKPVVGSLGLVSARATLRGGRTARFAVRCRGGACKRGTVTLRTGRTTLATGAVSLASGKKGYVTVRFTAAGRKAAARRRVLRTTALLAVTGGKTVRTTVTITSPKAKTKAKSSTHR